MSLLLVFVMVLVVNVCWTKYVIHAGAGRALPAALWDVGIVVLSALLTVEYVNNRWAVLAAAAGGFVGTYITVRAKKTEP
jgi:hypothetical protein